jgi:hypothetical protein
VPVFCFSATHALTPDGTMFRVSQDDLIGNGHTIEDAKEIIRGQPPGRYHVDEMRADPLRSGHTSRRWGVAIRRPDGSPARGGKRSALRGRATHRGKSKGHGNLNHESVMAKIAAKTAATQQTNTTFITQPCVSIL